MDNHRLNKYDLLLLCVFAYLIIVQLFAIWPFTIDDMYIPLRYAKNWVAGEGLVWNPQTPPVEGYSSFSFVVLGAIALLWGIDPIVFLKAAGCVGLIFTVIAVYWIARFNLNRQQAFIPCIGLLLYVGQIIWAASGLETAVYEA
ncbi:MAG: protein LphB, partial [Legionella sp.]